MHFWISKSIYPLLIKLPVITNLRHLCVDQESWKTLETVLGRSLDVETLTLSYLEETDIISYATKIQEVTNQLGRPTFDRFHSANRPHQSWKWYKTWSPFGLWFKHVQLCTSQWELACLQLFIFLSLPFTIFRPLLLIFTFPYVSFILLQQQKWNCHHCRTVLLSIYSSESCVILCWPFFKGWFIYLCLQWDL